MSDSGVGAVFDNFDTHFFNVYNVILYIFLKMLQSQNTADDNKCV